jgi:hypothetical protein
MNTADLVAEIERLIPCYDGLYFAHAQTGDEYLQFDLHGDDEALLCAMMLDTLTRYIDSCRGDGARLFWRYAEPRIFWYPDDQPEAPRGRLQTRLVVTHRSIIWFSNEEYDLARTLELERKMLGTPLAS